MSIDPSPVIDVAPGTSSAPLLDGGRRRLAIAALVAMPALAAASTLAQPALGDGPSGQLAALADGPRGPLFAVLFVLEQLPALVVALALGHVVRRRFPRLSVVGVCLSVLGAFGHTVFGGMTMVMLAMAEDAPNRVTYAKLLTRMQDSPLMLFSAAGLIGTVLGFAVLSVGLYRSGVGPRWVGPALWAFLVVEFVGNAFSRFASYLSLALLAVALVGLAARLSRRDTAW
jgi:hypothetical protein